MTPEIFQQYVWVFTTVAVWELAWKGIALWKAAHNNQKYWFIALLFINTAGIFPILYLLFMSNKVQNHVPATS